MSMNLKMSDIMSLRFSFRNYTDEKLSNDLVSKIVKLASMSASSLNLQPWQVYAVSGDKLQSLSQICMSQSHVASCSHALIICARTDLKSKDKYFMDFMADKDEKSKKWYLDFIKDRFDLMSDEEIYNYSSNQCYAFVANLVNIAFENDVKSCIVGGFNKNACDEFLNLPQNQKSVLVVTLGRSDEVCKTKSRRDINSILEFI